MRVRPSTRAAELLGLWLALGASAVAGAAEIKASSGCPLDIEISGSISAGDAERFERTISQASCHLSTVTLNSDGGDMGEAIKIGRTLRRTRAFAGVPVGDRCVSSCVLVFAGGASKFFGGRVGIHRPYFADARQLSAGEIATEWRRMTAELRQYLDEMNVSAALADAMISTAPEQVKWLSYEDLEGYGLTGDPIEEEVSVAEQASYYKLTSAEYRERQANALQACDALLRARPPFFQTPSEKSWNPVFICLDAEILQRPRAEITQRYEKARSMCLSFRDSCWQDIMVNGK
jgi:hypothetical protein